jgi:hypothetical protein
VIREYRGKVSLFAERQFAAETKRLYAIVYTYDAYMNDPDTKKDPQEHLRMLLARPTHVLITLLAYATDESPYGSRVLVHNIAGGNNEFIPRTTSELVTDLESLKGSEIVPVIPEIAHDLKMLHRWIELAQESERSEMEWVGVAD